MVNFIEVLQPGALTTVQDLGRFGYQQYGMGTAGVMDSFSFLTGNLLVGNIENAACLEVTLTGPKLLFHTSTIAAITGADMTAKLNDETLPLWQSFFVPAGSILKFGRLKKGYRTYICLAGGVQVPLVMGSRSTYLKGSLGGFKGRKLLRGDMLPIHVLEQDELSPDQQFKKLSKEYQPAYQENETVRAIPGPQDDYFTSASLADFFSSSFTVTANSDRMGYRLEGPLIKHIKEFNIISDAISPGAIQIPGDGNPIIMMADRQTTGGYPKIATIITADLPKVAQLKPGHTIKFIKTSLAESYVALKQMEVLTKKIC